jgi:hypothetical protein
LLFVLKRVIFVGTFPVTINWFARKELAEFFHEAADDFMDDSTPMHKETSA